MLDRRGVIARAGVLGLMTVPVASSSLNGRSGDTRSANHVATSLSELRAAPPSRGAMIYDGAVYTWTAGNHDVPPLGPANDVTVVQQDDTPLAEGAWVRRSGPLSVRMFGAVSGPGGSASDNTVAFGRAIAAAHALAVPLHLEGGDFALDADGEPSGGVNFARPDLHVRGDGATLRFTGRGRAFVLDRGGRGGDFLEGMAVEGVRIVGAPGVTDGFYMRGVVRSSFRNIAVLDVGGRAFWIRHAVSCHFDGLTYSAHRAGQPVPQISATHGLYLDNNNDEHQGGFYTADCLFTNAVMEGFPGIGCHIEDASGNLFAGGTFEACATGLVVAPASNHNCFVQLWMEANTVADAVLAGDSNGFVGPRFISSSISGANVRITGESRGTWFAAGGYIRHVDVAAGSRETSFHQVGVDQNLSGTIGFQGSGPYTRIGCRKVGPTSNVTGAYEDVIGAVAEIGEGRTWTPSLAIGRGTVTLNRTQSHGTCHKVGPIMFVQGVIQVDDVRSPGGRLSIGGLPYPSARPQAGSIQADGLRPSAVGAPQLRMEAGSTVLELSSLFNGAAVEMAGDIRAGTTILFSITYTVGA